jgi:hypothetical protein
VDPICLVLITLLANLVTCMLYPVNGDMCEVELWYIIK